VVLADVGGWLGITVTLVGLGIALVGATIGVLKFIWEARDRRRQAKAHEAQAAKEPSALQIYSVEQMKDEIRKRRSDRYRPEIRCDSVSLAESVFVIGISIGFVGLVISLVFHLL
jgi:hypothetical protein